MWKENSDWNAGGNYIPSANYRVQVEGHFVLHITDGVCVCVAVTTCTLAQSALLASFPGLPTVQFLIACSILSSF